MWEQGLCFVCKQSQITDWLHLSRHLRSRQTLLSSFICTSSDHGERCSTYHFGKYMVYTEPVCMSIAFDILKLKNRPLIICDLLFSIKKNQPETIWYYTCACIKQGFIHALNLWALKGAGCISIMTIFLFLDSLCSALAKAPPENTQIPLVFYSFPTTEGVHSFIQSVQSLSCVQLFVTPWTVAHEASCSSPTPGACSNSCPLSWWCHPTISSSVIPFSSCLKFLPASGSLMSQFFASDGQSIGQSIL